MIRSPDPDRAARVAADVCVIGAGAAGLTLARELAGTSLAVCVVESGDHHVPPDDDPVYDLRYTKLKISRDSRVRAFGGTTKVWAGRWKRFDPIDLERRDWIPRAEWPIDHDLLDPYYRRAAALIGIDENPAFADHGPDLLHSELIPPAVFHTQAKAERDWGQTWGRAAAAAPNVEVYLRAHVIALERSGRRVTRVVCRSGDGGTLTVDARAVVIAAGGIENARLLLIAQLGNEHDQVGRHYMDHPRVNIGVIELYDSLDRAMLAKATMGSPDYLGYRLADSIQRDERLLNSHVFFSVMLERELVWRVLRAAVPPRCRVLAVRNYLEQAPDPANRVFLVDEPDPFGLPKAGVTWTVGELDRRTIVAFHRHLQREVQRARLGELHSPLLRDPDSPAFDGIRDASHPMGATRMGRDPRTSVVDADCRLHAMDNVYVAGSSVFATSGYANPTATIVALAIRLADRLKAAA